MTNIRIILNNKVYEENQRDYQIVTQEFEFNLPAKYDGEDACEAAFAITNAPEDALCEEWAAIAREYYPLRSVSIGDAVVVNGVKYFCMNVGWRKLTKSSD